MKKTWEYFLQVREHWKYEKSERDLNAMLCWCIQSVIICKNGKHSNTERENREKDKSTLYIEKSATLMIKKIPACDVISK
jgi:hypothetical protein